MKEKRFVIVGANHDWSMSDTSMVLFHYRAIIAGDEHEFSVQAWTPRLELLHL